MRGGCSRSRRDLPFCFSWQSISCAVQVINRHLHSRANFVRVDPLVMRNSGFAAEPVAECRGVVPTQCNLRPFGIGPESPWIDGKSLHYRVTPFSASTACD